MRLFAPLIALALSAPSLLAAQGVLVAPHVVFLDHRTRSAAITLYNPGTEPAEVSIATFFGYPVTDSAGEFELATPAPDPTQPSAAAWIEAFPRRIVVQPLQRQTVRILGRPPAGLPDGEYWSRLIITAKGGTIPVAGADTTQAIQVGLSLEVRTIIPLQYRKGDVKTGVQLEHLRASRLGDSLVIRAQLTRDGNAAFVGTARATLTNAAGAIVAKAAVPLAVYYAIDPRFLMGVRDLPAGQYRLTLELVSERTDIAPESILHTAPARSSIDLVLP